MTLYWNWKCGLIGINTHKKENLNLNFFVIIHVSFILCVKYTCNCAVQDFSNFELYLHWERLYTQDVQVSYLSSVELTKIHAVFTHCDKQWLTNISL